MEYNQEMMMFDYVEANITTDLSQHEVDATKVIT